MALLFVASALLAVAGSATMVTRRNPVYGLLCLLLAFCGAAGMFYTMNATFLAVAQILVYAGAMSVLFLFVLMFVDLKRNGEVENLPPRVNHLSSYNPDIVKEEEIEEESIFVLSFPAALFSVILFGMLGSVIMSLPEDFASFAFNGELNNYKIADRPGVPDPAVGDWGAFGGIRAFGHEMIDTFALHYEVVGLVVLVGVIGAVVLGRRLAGLTAKDIQEGNSPSN